MTDLNHVVEIGTLVRDVEIAQPSADFTIGRGTIAVNRTRTSNGNKTEEVSYFDFRLFGKLAENLKPYLLKGKKIAIDGYLKQERWVDKNTNTNRSAVYIGVNELELLSSKSEGVSQPAPIPQNYAAPAATPNVQRGYQQQPNYQPAPQSLDNFPEDYPF